MRSSFKFEVLTSLLMGFDIYVGYFLVLDMFDM